MKKVKKVKKVVNKKVVNKKVVKKVTNPKVTNPKVTNPKKLYLTNPKKLYLTNPKKLYLKKLYLKKLYLKNPYATSSSNSNSSSYSSSNSNSNSSSYSSSNSNSNSSSYSSSNSNSNSSSSYKSKSKSKSNSSKSKKSKSKSSKSKSNKSKSNSKKSKKSRKKDSYNISKHILINFKTSDFNFTVPKKLIPNKPRIDNEKVRLMVLNRDNMSIDHQYIYNFNNYFFNGDTLVFNNTKMYKSILYGKKEKTGDNIQVYLLREVNKKEKSWEVLVQPARKIRIGNRLFFLDENNEKMLAVVHDNTISKGRILKFNSDLPNKEFKRKINHLGKIQSDIYTDTDFKNSFLDLSKMQTIYAKKAGSTSPHFPGLHFSKLLLKKLELQGVNFSYITLHLGTNTYEKILVEDLQKHRMKEEYFNIPIKACKLINSSLKSQKKVCAVGTSTLRALESSVSTYNTLNPNKKWTNKFIYPYYKFHIVNSILTNFHPPKSTLIPLLSAFTGYEFLMKAYDIAIKEKYKFYNFGDAMLIL
ncbi:S-adenosylmethionine:tRNA ribosyltransferase-isomerase [Candidatus Karelsulcia muelleri]|uniref:tRNA preQ1(34) S-adenosylmethionine ribosyltransferase-isomerase QueA n=1 Tax=Candidatus Karelsulcia muelleri TaxID=336810 RepID=UPI001FF2389C|nr:tRNA preQ1(34) S-adenosylmethionine ribosyltransferase-isomerase QueA [Candidatus Karelsulcia muelleri]UOQ32946.1 S-adenosylmethionine:tRNA ribosyltransferase-isomerase [Candidatus Karelsulcia muelleri]